MFYFNNLTPAAKSALNLAALTAQKLGYSFIGTQHLLMGLIKAKNSVSSLILNATINLNEIESKLKLKQTRNYIKNFKQPKLTYKNYTPTLKNIINAARKKCQLMGIKRTGTQQILLEFLKHEKSCGLNLLKQVDNLIESNLFAKSLACNYSVMTTELKDKQTSTTRTINLFGKNLTKLAKRKKLDPLIGRHNELAKMEQILCRRKKNNPCLIGEPGVGKTAIVEGLALKIARKNVLNFLKNKQIFAINLSSILAGTKYRGEFEQRLESIINEAKNNKQIILFFDEIHTIVNAGAAQGAIDAANILKPCMARGEIQIVGTTTKNEFRKMIMTDPALERRLQPIEVREPSAEETFKIINGIKFNYEKFHKIKISNQSIETAISLSKKHFKNRYLPDIAIDLIDEAASKKKLNVSKFKTRTLTCFDVASLVNQKLC